jgi:hypothetical protein
VFVSSMHECVRHRFLYDERKQQKNVHVRVHMCTYAHIHTYTFAHTVVDFRHTATCKITEAFQRNNSRNGSTKSKKRLQPHSTDVNNGHIQRTLITVTFNGR